MIEYLQTSTSVFNRLKKVIKTATTNVYLEYFSVAQSVMFCELTDILISKAKQGVEIKILTDRLGSFLLLPHSYKKALKSLGVEIKYHNGKFPFILGKRDHIKLAVIDNKIALIGGLNLDDKYVNNEELCGHWKESGVIITTSNLTSLSSGFLNRFNGDFNQNKTSCFYYNTFDNKTLTNKYLTLIKNAKKEITIISPYVVPDSKTVLQIVNAIKRGVNVTLIIPYRPDKRSVYCVTKTQCNFLSLIGVKIYTYDRGFIHQKLILADDVAMVGSCNFDRGSFEKFSELDVLCSEENFINHVKQDLISIKKDCSLFSGEITLKEKIIAFILKPFYKYL